MRKSNFEIETEQPESILFRLSDRVRRDILNNKSEKLHELLEKYDQIMAAFESAEDSGNRETAEELLTQANLIVNQIEVLGREESYDWSSLDKEAERLTKLHNDPKEILH